MLRVRPTPSPYGRLQGHQSSNSNKADVFLIGINMIPDSGSHPPSCEEACKTIDFTGTVEVGGYLAIREVELG